MSETPSLGDAFVRAERMVARRIADEFVLVPIVGHGAQVDSIYNLTGAGVFIWEQLDGRRTGSEIVDALMARFEVDRATAERDYRLFIAKLLSIGAVSVAT
jgi:hypothetical protein